MKLYARPDLDKTRGIIIYVFEDTKDLKHFISKKSSLDFVSSKVKSKENIVSYTDNSGSTLHFLHINKELDINKSNERARQLGSELFQFLRGDSLKIQFTGATVPQASLLNVLEGFILASYTFNKYKTVKKQVKVSEIVVIYPAIQKKQLDEIKVITEAVFIARDLVNEPANHLTAEQLSENIKALGEKSGFAVEVFRKSRIKTLKMGGLLGVNQGSIKNPTFTVIEYKHPKAKNKKPFVLVGKGVVFDTGGLSLKDANGMEHMKADMAGAAVVAGTIYAIASLNLPVYLVGLIPATDNRPSGDAIAPGDVITISNGKTVEVLNTDAEGRLILADALSYASRYKPELVIDLATLTGAAARAIGKEGMVMMSTCSEHIKKSLILSGFEVHERIVEFPLWNEYGKELESDIADLKNIGSATAGAITAGKFLEHFTDYPWIHLDIAGVAFAQAPDTYRPANGTGIGVRLLYNFIKKNTI